MKTIQKLSQTEAQKIAAGEVVERPANSAKELIENALDAQATTITLRAQNGGKDFLNVTDNGIGMSKEDISICFERYTTSKITSFDQLDSIKTFGFRGEALASICSVAHVTITSKQKDALEGTRIFLEDGQLKDQKTVGCAHGTTVEVQSLFYNIPARRKFLKTTATEWNHILTLFKAYALNNINVHFILEHDDVVVYNCPAVKTVKERVEQLFDETVFSHTLTLTETATRSSDIQISGVITTQQYTRYDRGGLFFFVNRRWVKNFQLANAAIKGYLNLLPSGRYPAVFISITINPQTVDVNVHPKKEEVQFLNPKIVATALTNAVKTSLENHLSDQLKQNVRIPSASKQAYRESLHQIPPPLSFSNRQTTHPTPPPFPFVSPIPSTQQQNSFPTQKKEFAPQPPKQPLYRLIGQYKQTYLLLEHTDGLFILDQHAAHERILYERFSQRFEEVAVVTLLFPHTLSFAADDLALLQPFLPLLRDLGVQCEPFSKTNLIIKATPVFLKNQPLDDILHAMLGWIKEESDIEKGELFKKITERVRAQMACKAAVKAGDELSLEKMKTLLRDLENTNNRFTCPHGRPTSWLFKLTELEKKFKRRT